MRTPDRPNRTDRTGPRLTSFDRRLLLVALLPASFVVLLLVRPPLFLELWPLAGTSDLAFTFLASIAAAAVASIVWAATQGERRSYGCIGLYAVVIFRPLFYGLDR